MATGSFTIGDAPLRMAASLSPGRTAAGAEAAFGKIKDEWTYDATNDAPLRTGNLRDQINGESSAKGVLLRDNAVNGGFNYSYYIHEVKGRTYLDDTLDEAEAKQILEDKIRRALFSVWGGP